MNERHEQIIELLEKHGGNKVAAAKSIMKDGDSEDLVLYLLCVGIQRVKATLRRNVRRDLKNNELQLDIRPKRGKFPINLERSRKSIQRRTLDILATWMIGDMPLGDMDRDGLLEQARRERRAGLGHVVNAVFYERLAEPLGDTELVKEYWKNNGVRILHDAVLQQLSIRDGGTRQRAEDRTTVA